MDLVNLDMHCEYCRLSLYQYHKHFDLIHKPALYFREMLKYPKWQRYSIKMITLME